MFFFFSSRRRHTRYWRDWSSDVCSSDLKQYEAVIVASIVQAEGGQAEYGDVAGAIYNRLKPNDQTNGFLQVDSAVTYGLGTKSYNFTDERSEEHTSELQSRQYLVCRLLLEKKKN